MFHSLPLFILMDVSRNHLRGFLHPVQRRMKYVLRFYNNLKVDSNPLLTMFARCWCSLSLQQVVDKTMRVHRINFGDPVSHKMISMQSEFAVFTSAQVVTVNNKTVLLDDAGEGPLRISHSLDATAGTAALIGVPDL